MLQLRAFAILMSLVLAGCEAIQSSVDELRRTNPYSDINDPDAEFKRLQSAPQCWWEQPYQTICERASAGRGEVCRPVPIGKPTMICVGSGPQFPYSQNRR